MAMNKSKNSRNGEFGYFEAKRTIVHNRDGNLVDKMDYEAIPDKIGGQTAPHSNPLSQSTQQRKLIDMKDHFFDNFEKNSESLLQHDHGSLSRRATTLVQQTSRQIGSGFDVFKFAERKSRERITFDEYSSVRILDFAAWRN